MDQGAADDAERDRNRARRYAPPKGSRGQRRARTPGAAVDAAGARALVEQLEAEDKRLTGRRSG